MELTIDRVRVFFISLAPAVAWLKRMTQGEQLLLVATLCFGAVGSYGTYLYYMPSRGGIIGGAAATGIELLYIGAAGVAVTRPTLRGLAFVLMFIGSVGSTFFGVMVSLREAVPMMFGTVVVWPSQGQWIVLGVPAIVEGVVPALAALLLSWFLHSTVSHRLVDSNDREHQILVRRAMKPFACPFCPFSEDTPAKLWGHYGRCQDAIADTRPADDKRAIVQTAVREGHERMIKG